MRDNRRLTRALVAAAVVVPRSAAKSPGTFAVGWRPRPSGSRHSGRGSRLSRLVSDQSLIGSGVSGLPRVHWSKEASRLAFAFPKWSPGIKVICYWIISNAIAVANTVIIVADERTYITPY